MEDRERQELAEWGQGGPGHKRALHCVFHRWMSDKGGVEEGWPTGALGAATKKPYQSLFLSPTLTTPVRALFRNPGHECVE